MSGWGFGMDLHGYRGFVLSRWCVDPVTDPEDAITHARLMLMSELGEIAGMWQKTFQGHPPPTTEQLLDELGDVLFCLVAIDAVKGRHLGTWEQHGSSAHAFASTPIDTREPAEWLSALMTLAHNLSDNTWSAHIALVNMSRICRALGHTLDELAAINYRKLTARYPMGFDSSRSINRGA